MVFKLNYLKQTLCCLFLLFAPLQAAWLHLGTQDQSYQKLIDLVLHSNYTQALAQADSLKAAEPKDPAACFFKSLVYLSRYDDLSLSADLKKAEAELEACSGLAAGSKSSEASFWKGMIAFQQGYVAQVQGSAIRATMKTRGGAQLLKQIPDNQDAQTFYGIYGYYADQLTQGLAWVPFVEDNREEYVQHIQAGADSSRYFSSLAATSLVWMRYDRGELEAALRLCEGFLAKYPKHRVFNQMRGDMLFRLGRVEAARLVYQKSLESYEAVAPKSIRYYCAVANLLRISAALNLEADVQHFRGLLNSADFKSKSKGMPASLMASLKKENLL
jgi:predicted negative regulator of RcsB-dependent stress response